MKIYESSTKHKSIIDPDKIAETSMNNKATKALSCKKSGKSVQKVSKQRQNSTDNNNEYCVHISSTPLLRPNSPVVATCPKNTPLIALKPVRLQSSLQIRKFRLQLFPIDEPTRKSLEEENHCPYLELTINTKKKIASVIKHLNLKWGNIKGALEELVLFPYNARAESLESFERWSLMDSYITVAEVHDAVGKPAVFRLRYGWLNARMSFNRAVQSSSEEVKRELVDQNAHLSSGANQFCEPIPAKVIHNKSFLGSYAMKSIQAADNLRSENVTNLSLIDGISNMSFGALFSTVADDGDKVCSQMPQHLIPVSCDSFDTAIAAHISRYQTGNHSTAQPSILDAEETCNPYSFHSHTTSNKYILHHSTNASCQTEEPHTMKLQKAQSPLLEHDEGDGCLLSNKTFKSEDDGQSTAEGDAQLVVDLQGFKQVEKEEMQINLNATTAVSNEFEGLDMHWPLSVDPWQFGVTPQQMINSENNELNGIGSTSMDMF